MQEFMFRRLAIAGAFASLAALAASPAAGAQPYKVTLMVAPAIWDGHCPVKIDFGANIVAKFPGPVQYRFIASTGGVTPVNTVNFAAPGAQIVSVQGSLSHSYDGWVALEIISPVSMTSKHGKFMITCR